MGLDLKQLTVREKTKLESFASKAIAIDAYNAMYQFLSIIRGPDGLHLWYGGRLENGCAQALRGSSPLPGVRSSYCQT